MNAKGVREALHRHWPDDEYLKLEEVGEDASRQGRKIDMLVLTLWRSRGYQREAVEIKVSMSDLRREIKNPAKADFWWRHTNRFWIAVPATLVDKAKVEIPANWGLLSCSEKGVRAVCKPEVNRNPEPFTWQMQVGMMRCAADCGSGVRSRAYSDGYEAGRKVVEQRLGSRMRSLQDDFALREFEALKATVNEFEQETGITIRDRGGWSRVGGRQVGRIVNTLRDWRTNPILVGSRLDGAITSLKRQIEDLERLDKTISEALRPEAEEGVA